MVIRFLEDTSSSYFNYGWSCEVIHNTLTAGHWAAALDIIKI